MREKEEIHKADSIEESIDELAPKMKVEITKGDVECIVKDEQLLGIYDEILNDIRQDRVEIDSVLENFVDMVLNSGDASSASKEAIVNLIKIKSDTADKMVKVADLMTRIKLKDNNTMPRWLAAQQNNKIVVEGSSKRQLLKTLQKRLDNNKDGSKNA